MPLAERSFRITCVELGEALAAAARRNLRHYPDVRVVHADFDRWQPDAYEPFDLVFAVTAWHWTDHVTRHSKAAALLRLGGHLALWDAGHVFPDDGDQFFRDIQPVYAAIGHALPADATWPAPGELPDSRTDIESSGLLDAIFVRHIGRAVERSDTTRVDEPHRFAIDILEIVHTTVGTPPDHLVIESWHVGRGVHRQQRQ